jgi:hypothetical protein
MKNKKGNNAKGSRGCIEAVMAGGKIRIGK